MTRYTKLERKRHVDASESFSVTPLMPSKNVQPSSSTSIDGSTPSKQSETPKERKAQGEKNASKKRKAEDSSVAHNGATPGEAAVEDGTGPSKKAKGAKKKGKGKNKGEAGENGPTGGVDNSAKSERRRLRRQKEKGNAAVCFACRKTGHSAKNCKESSGVGMCYSCGSLEHMTKDCKKLSKDGNKFKFATCFVCKEQGHLAGQCPKNERGLYPNGGSCRFCDKVDHLAKDCKLTKEDVGTVTLGKIDLVQGADDDDFHIFVDEKRKLVEEQKTIKRMVKPQIKTPKKVVSF
ncbi:hypothetical protein BC939DRAFT_460189 [Gamsiella multidivaricata]|uniref:uncharacterized protein n=1 Tax=Gamsiella multidivaricata TaxID=101098 RepID=UPI00221F6528|nr:uncharacterized protein BC939DRAFT_460189 [Gamsiella multidivaricata]KAG0364094.1 hypothetical protein BGZ54_007847 [Gamsiella multidivaricata]KAI7819419.1 hypothetical protein BC939DRAFT_460189 [Gamsiella multidivaricata]